MSEGVGATLLERVGRGATVAMCLSPTTEAIAALIGAWRAGLRVASLPTPTKAQISRLSSYLTTIRNDVEVAAFLGPKEVADSIVIPGFVGNFCDVQGERRLVEEWDRAAFVQFSSGSTGNPKGVALSLEAIAENTEQIIDAVRHDDPVVCSWMPLAHDMGLMLLLTTWAGARLTRTVGVRLLDPRSFVLSPTNWLRECSTIRATLIGMSNQAMEHVATRVKDLGDVDLSSIKACILGSEPLRAHSIRRFAITLGPNGFDSNALCPAYGLAEVAVAATMTRISEPWHTVDVDGAEHVALGRPLDRTAIRISCDADSLGAIQLRTPSMMTGYVGRSSQPFTTDGWLTTSDAGAIVDGELVVLGRMDDVLNVGGRKLYATELEAMVAGVAGLQLGQFAALPDGAGRYAILVEERGGTTERAREILAAVRSVLVPSAGVAPSRVVIVRRGVIPRTSNGKLQRREAGSAYQADELEITCSSDDD